MKEICLVVPSIRENCMKDFIERWKAIGLFDVVDLLIMEDNPQKSFQIQLEGSVHLSWEDIEQDLGSDSWIIPRQSDTVRSYAYLVAWRKGYKYVMTLDDDCYPCDETDGMTYDGPGFVNEHVKWLTARTKWFNTLNAVTPRGIPYYNKGRNDKVVINHGLWTNVLDYDAPRQLVAPEKETFTFDNKVVPNGAFFPMCGMNVMWKREATVLMYHLLMGSYRVGGRKDPDRVNLAKFPFDRFGDIWCGILAKKICDIRGFNMSTGLPYIHHERASSPFANLKKEANGIEVNEGFWEYVDSFNPRSYTDNEQGTIAVYEDMGRHIKDFKKYHEHDGYFEKLGEAMVTWAKLFRKVGE